MSKQFIQPLIGRGLFVLSMMLVAAGTLQYSHAAAAPTAATQGAYYAGSATAVVNWSNAANSTGAPNSVCSNSSQPNGAVNLTNFSFSIPAGSTITGILVEPKAANVEGDQPGKPYQPRNVRAPKAMETAQLLRAGVLAGTAKGTWSTASGDCGASVFSSLGGAGDTWGASWTVDDINNAGFGVRLTDSAGVGPVIVDAVRITVFYDPLGPKEVPEGDTILLLGGGLSGLGVWLRYQWGKRQKKGD